MQKTIFFSDFVNHNFFVQKKLELKYFISVLSESKFQNRMTVSSKKKSKNASQDILSPYGKMDKVDEIGHSDANLSLLYQTCMGTLIFLHRF